jgi:hypothetical protein
VRFVAPIVAVVLFAVVPVAEARRVGIAVKGVAFCAERTVRVQLTNGSIATRTHADPGRQIRSVAPATQDLVVHVRINASWPTVQRGAGQRLRVRADGPGGERWEWRFRLRNPLPLDDRTPYEACLKIKTRSGRFVTKMKANPGPWRLSARITGGSLVTSQGAVTIDARG